MTLTSNKEPTMIQLVFAHSNLAFGHADGMPWKHVSQDFKNFKARTENTILVMGAKTFASLPGILPKRIHRVFGDVERVEPTTKNGMCAYAFDSIDSFDYMMKRWKENDADISIIGGRALLEMGLKYADKVIMTELHLNELKTPITQHLNHSFIEQIKFDFDMVESHWYNLDQTGFECLEECVYVRKRS